MNKFVLILILLIWGTGATAVHSGLIDRSLIIADPSHANNVHISSAPSPAKTDTIWLMGGSGRGDGKFQDDSNSTIPDWEGWTSIDMLTEEESKWHIDLFHSPTGTNAMWCGEIFVPCSGDITGEGYGNGYLEWLDWRGIVADNNVSTNLTVSYDLNYDNEPGYDFLYLLVETSLGWNTVASYNGQSPAPANESNMITVPAVDLVGAGVNEVHLRFEASTDRTWSEEDCMWPTDGLAQIDNISVSGDNGLMATFDDFESGPEFASWQAADQIGFGNFGQIWSDLDDIDPCVDNLSPQVVFIDDGIIVPCTGGTLGTTWTYGFGSYTHNLTGGCLGPQMHLNNEVWSPAIPWTDEAGNSLNMTHRGAHFDFGVYAHLPLPNGMFYEWHVRSSNDGGVTWDTWRDRQFVYTGTGEYFRQHEDVTDLILPDPTHIQVAMGVNEIGWLWGFNGTDGTPSPYFDNVAVKVFEIGGPVLAAREVDLAQDNFPAIGEIDYVNLARNSIRFDMASDIIGAGFEHLVVGDSLVFGVSVNRPGAVLVQTPTFHYVMKANPLFDPYRTHPTSGTAFCDEVSQYPGVSLGVLWSFDLPDQGFFFPGDVIHYYVEASDVVGGDIRTSTLPADLTAYGIFPGDASFTPMHWPSSFTVHGLPTMFSDVPGDQPGILLWNDFGDAGGENEWQFALGNLGFVEGTDYDLYYTNAPLSGVSNGLGSRATPTQIAGYDLMLYSCGDLISNGITSFTLGGGQTDKSNDDDLLDAWLQMGKDLLVTGDNVVTDLYARGGADGANFITTWFSVDYQDESISFYNGGVLSPLVSFVPGNSLSLGTEFIAYSGDCSSMNGFDVVTAIGTAETIATWEGGAPTPYAAGILNQVGGSRIVYFPSDLMHWYTPNDYSSPSGMSLAARTDALGEVMQFFGSSPTGSATGVDEAPRVLASRAWPNPFNPKTTLEYAVPRAGHVSVKLYDMRGKLVRTLVDENVAAGTYQRVWNGNNDQGAAVASGVYFAETRFGGQNRVEKLALVR